MNLNFNGVYHMSMDKSGRVTVPAAIRKALGDDELVLYVKPKERCIRGYARKDFNEMVSTLLLKMENDPSTDYSNLKRHFSLNSVSYEIDKKNRITLYKKFLDMTGISKDVTFCGLGTRFEIWDSEAYEAIVNGVELTVLPF